MLLPEVELFGFVRCRGNEGALKFPSDSTPEEGALEMGVGRRMVKETFSTVAMVVQEKGGFGT